MTVAQQSSSRRGWSLSRSRARRYLCAPLRYPAGLLCLAIIVALAWVPPAVAGEQLAVAAEWTVTKTVDTFDGACNSDCSLREAVHAANVNPGDDRILLPAGTYELTIDTYLLAEDYGSLDVGDDTGTTSIVGAGRDVTYVDAGTLRTKGLLGLPDRVFSVGFQASLELVGITVTGGYGLASGSGISGGGIMNSNGTLVLADSAVIGNVAGLNGGGIANHVGFVTLTNTILADNNTDPPEYSTNSSGGGLYNRDGTVVITDSTIIGNASDWGGGIANDDHLDSYNAEVTVVNSLIAENSAHRGGGIAHGMALNNDEPRMMTIIDSVISDNRAERGADSLGSNNAGGGIFNVRPNAILTVIRSTISTNTVRATHTVWPWDGSGGGIYNDSGQVDVTDSTIDGNVAVCDQGIPGDLCPGGRGGGIFTVTRWTGYVGNLSITNSTISGNTAALENRNPAPHLGGGAGGGLAHLCAGSVPSVTTVEATTITSNSADTGAGIDTAWDDLAGNVYACPGLSVQNSIVAGNSTVLTPLTEDCWGSFVSAGHNLFGATSGCSGSVGDILTEDPGLAVLADNGGATRTHALFPTSPAIDAGTTALGTDQRGVARPQGSGVDIGSYETENPGQSVPPGGVGSAGPPTMGGNGANRSTSCSLSRAWAIGLHVCSRQSGSSPLDGTQR